MNVTYKVQVFKYLKVCGVEEEIKMRLGRSQGSQKSNRLDRKK